MTNKELIEQFKRCEQWNDPVQWELLALAYYQRGYFLNAICCFQRADAYRASVAVETESLELENAV